MSAVDVSFNGVCFFIDGVMLGEEFAGSASVDDQGHVEAVTLEGYSGGKSKLITLKRPPRGALFSAQDGWIERLCSEVQSQCACSIVDALQDYRDSRLDGPEYDANEAA